jgi:peroxiredoxin
MKKIAFLCAAAMLFFTSAPAMAAQVGQPAPEITATDINGAPFKLSDHKGKTVILEWTNAQCPFVVKHYETGNMQKTQQAAIDKGAVWVTINSSAPGLQGHVTAEEQKNIIANTKAVPTTAILDESGEIGKAYDAQTTPHMFIVNAEGTLVYAGAIDDNSSPRHDTVEGAKNHVLAALDEIVAGKAVTTATTPPYGCAVKYAQ